MLLIELREKVELAALLGLVGVLVLDVLDELFDFLVLGVDVGALEDAREEAALPVLGFLDGVAAGAHDDEAGEVLVVGAEAVGDPGAHGGANQAGLAAVHEEEAG